MVEVGEGGRGSGDPGGAVRIGGGTMEKHALNDGFEWDERRGPFKLLEPVQAIQYNEQGYLVFGNAFDDETVDALLAEVDPIEEAAAEFLRTHLNGRAFIARADEINFAPHVVTRCESARAFTRSRFFLDLAHDLLGPDVRLYWDQLVYKKPGNPEVFPWHQDNGYTFIEPQQYLTCWVALSDANEDNGCPYVIPGLHREGTYAHRMTDLGWECDPPRSARRVAAPVRKGGVVVFSSLTPHMTGPNLTDQVRKTYIVQFAPEGACVITRNDGQRESVHCADPERQYAILAGGRAVGASG